MARFGYLAVLIIALGNVGFGLDWLSAPMSPMPDSGRAAQAAVPATPPAPISGPGPLAPASPDQPQTVGAKPPREAAANEPATPITCNVSACASAYHSFRAADCSYQPSGGPRRRCTKK